MLKSTQSAEFYGGQMERRVRVEYNKERGGLDLYVRKGNPGTVELVAELNNAESVDFYSNVKIETENNLFKQAEDAVILFNLLIKEHPELKELVDKYKRNLEKNSQVNSSP